MLSNEIILWLNGYEEKQRTISRNAEKVTGRENRDELVEQWVNTWRDFEVLD